MNARSILEKQHYSLVGGHSAVQICRWAKKSLLDGGFCYKQKFYGIPSHQCCQMSPWIGCENSCKHCWRAIELDINKELKNSKINEPQKIIEHCISSQRKMLSGFKGNKRINMKKFLEAQNPKNFAISLIGEPTLYPKLGGLILELNKLGKISFLVTNGLYPEKLKLLEKKKALPTQLYVSLNSPDKRGYIKWHNSKLKNAWEKFNKTLNLMKKLKKKTRTVIRMTLAKDENMKPEMIKDYARLIMKASPWFIEVKGYVSVGYARKRLGYEKMPRHELVKDFAVRLLKFLPKYKFLDEKKESAVILLGKSRKDMKIKRV